MANGIQTYDAIVIGAGFSGMYMIKALRDKLGLKVRAYEAGETVGGTWYWNRYPGARCHSDSYIYCFTWDKQLLQEWEWSAEASAEWCDAHPNSYPPTILHVTDGQSTDGSPEDVASALQRLHTNDGCVLLFNLHVTAGGGQEIVFPTAEGTLFDEYSRMLFRMSSELPPHLAKSAGDKGSSLSG